MALAAAAVVLFGLSLRTPTPTPAGGVVSALGTGEVAVPIVLDSPALASTLRIGDIIDVVRISEDGRGSLIATDARVLETSTPGGMPDAVIVLAVEEARGHGLAEISTSQLSVVIRQRAGGLPQET
jgi:hypothetical protein